MERYAHLLDFWNSWYAQYYNTDIPRLIVRYEDLMTHMAGGTVELDEFLLELESMWAEGEDISTFQCATAPISRRVGAVASLARRSDRTFVTTAL